ncbi:NAD(P)H-binding protein [Nocardiopsis suaedae]|uniref:NAD(P)H-binding protein n=1 Tax=Nocardiopsis suaedae TaxID=3018444 RepID=A0ABT4TJC1_9ACTN|nr:NAD(P)H-binding protein [Nocardiopsis suaedae]MDA2804772.1 NAD(P)H-binding protein [Nocardiopsis suaedae]
MIVVTGSTGNIGRPLVEALTSAGESVTAVSRDPIGLPARARHFAGDLADPSGLEPAFKGADRMFLMVPDPALPVDEIVATARTAGVGRIVLLSSQRAQSRNDPFLTGMERTVTGAVPEWTVLRPGGFASNALLWAESIRSTRTVTAPFGDVALPPIDPADIAAVAAAALLGNDHLGRYYTLNGPRAVTPREQTAAIADALGEPVAFIEQTRAQAFEELSQVWPPAVVDKTLDALGTPTPEERTPAADTETALGRAPLSFTDWAARNVDAFR